MNDGSTTETFGADETVDLADPGAASLTLTTTGYCAGCGAWDAHSLTCNTCGYDFAGGLRDPA